MTKFYNQVLDGRWAFPAVECFFLDDLGRVKNIYNKTAFGNGGWKIQCFYFSN